MIVSLDERLIDITSFVVGVDSEAHHSADPGIRRGEGKAARNRWAVSLVEPACASLHGLADAS